MNMDSYIEFKGNQIYVYDTVANLWQVTPWDFNASFGLWNTNSFIPSTYAMIPNSISNGCIADKLNSNPQLKTYYLDAMCKLNSIVGDTTAYFNKIDMWKAQIQQAVYDDTRKHITNADFDNGVEYGFHTLFGENQPALKTLITQRLAVITQGLANENYNCQSVLGLHEFQNTSSVKIFPNPAHNNIKIDLEERSQNITQVSIYNTMGQVVQNQKGPSLSINIEKLNPGIYFVVVQNGEINYTSKFIKD